MPSRGLDVEGEGSAGAGGGGGAPPTGKSARGHAEPRTGHPRRGISDSARRGWGPADREKGPRPCRAEDWTWRERDRRGRAAGVGPRRQGKAPAAMPSRGLDIRGEASAIARGGGGAPPTGKRARGHAEPRTGRGGRGIGGGGRRGWGPADREKRPRPCRAEDWTSEARHQR